MVKSDSTRALGMTIDIIWILGREDSSFDQQRVHEKTSGLFAALCQFIDKMDSCIETGLRSFQLTS